MRLPVAAKMAFATAAAIGGETVTYAGSVTEPTACAAVVELAVSRFGGLDAVSHNAGIQRYGDVVTTTDALWDEVRAKDKAG